jgi:hypothetical protein
VHHRYPVIPYLMKKLAAAANHDASQGDQAKRQGNCCRFRDSGQGQAEIAGGDILVIQDISHVKASFDALQFFPLNLVLFGILIRKFLYRADRVNMCRKPMRPFMISGKSGLLM